MPSLDGYSLNEKMDKKFEEINEKIEAVHWRVETEINELKTRFASLYEKQEEQKNKFFSKPKVKEEPVVEAPKEESAKKGWFGSLKQVK